MHCCPAWDLPVLGRSGFFEFRLRFFASFMFFFYFLLMNIAAHGSEQSPTLIAWFSWIFAISKNALFRTPPPFSKAPEPGFFQAIFFCKHLDNMHWNLNISSTPLNPVRIFAKEISMFLFIVGKVIFTLNFRSLISPSCFSCEQSNNYPMKDISLNFTINMIHGCILFRAFIHRVASSKWCAKWFKLRFREFVLRTVASLIFFLVVLKCWLNLRLATLQIRSKRRLRFLSTKSLSTGMLLITRKQSFYRTIAVFWNHAYKEIYVFSYLSFWHWI